MAKSISAKRKRPGRPATGFNPMYGARLSDELVEQIDAWAEDNEVSRSEAIRRLVELGLKRKTAK
jgi:hypothetical protein